MFAALETAGEDLGERLSKTVSDALRWKMRRRRVVRVGRANYAIGTMPRSTAWWIRACMEAHDEWRLRRATHALPPDP